MDRVKPALTAFATKFKRVFLVAVVAVIGLLLVLAGLGQLDLSRSLTLYSGVALLVLAVLFYALP